MPERMKRKMIVMMMMMLVRMMVAVMPLQPLLEGRFTIETATSINQVKRRRDSRSVPRLPSPACVACLRYPALDSRRLIINFLSSLSPLLALPLPCLCCLRRLALP